MSQSSQSSSGKSGKTSGTAKPNKKVTRASLAGLQFPVARIGRFLRKGRYAARIGSGASVYLGAVLEYLTAEILELAGNAAFENRRQRIIPRHIQIAIRNDDELTRLLGNATIASGGVMPHIQPALLPKKQAEELMGKHHNRMGGKGKGKGKGKGLSGKSPMSSGKSHGHHKTRTSIKAEKRPMSAARSRSPGGKAPRSHSGTVKSGSSAVQTLIKTDKSAQSKDPKSSTPTKAGDSGKTSTQPSASAAAQSKSGKSGSMSLSLSQGSQSQSQISGTQSP